MEEAQFEVAIKFVHYRFSCYSFASINNIIFLLLYSYYFVLVHNDTFTHQYAHKTAAMTMWTVRMVSLAPTVRLTMATLPTVQALQLH